MVRIDVCNVALEDLGCRLLASFCLLNFLFLGASLFRLLHHVGLVPVIDFVGRHVEVEENLDEVELEFVVIWLLLEFEFEDLVDEWNEALAFLTVLGELLGVDSILDFLNMGEFLLLSLLRLFPIIVGKEYEVAIDQVQEEVNQRNQVVSPAQSVQLKSVLAGKNQVALEQLLLLFWNMGSVWLDIFFRKPKINDLDFMQAIFVAWQLLGVADHDIVELEVIVVVPCLMNNLE